ncbi:MAG: MFS transporter [Candidatus Woesearchaeota archaeon]|nr:MAG: MFS transporter [Candidatus Woesearchaeota archaeon]
MDSSIKSNIWKMYLFGFFRSLHFMGGVLVPFYTIWAGLSLTQVLLIQSWFMVWIFILEVPTGAVADYIGRKGSILISGFFGVLAPIVYTIAPNIMFFLIGELLWALSFSLISGAGDALVYDTLKQIKKEKESKKVFGKTHSSQLAGIMIAAPIGSVIAQTIGLRETMLFMALPIAIAVIISLTFKEPKATEELEKRYFKILKEGVIYFKNHKTLRVLATDFIFVGMIAYFTLWFYQPKLMNSGLMLGYLGSVHAILVLVEIIIMNSYSSFERVLGSKKRLIFISSLIPGVFLVIAGLVSYLPLLILLIIIAGGLSFGRRPLMQNYMHKYIPSDKRATVISSVFMMQTLVLAVMNPIVGKLADWSLNNTFIILGVAALIFTFISKIEEDILLD